MKRWIAVLIFTIGLVCCSSAKAQATPLPGYAQIASAVSGVTYTDNYCAASQKCFYYVTAADSLGESAPGNIVNATVPVTSTVHTVVLSWTASTTTGVTYNVYRGTVPLPPQGLTATAQ
jgi:hypothetical protein